MAQDRLGILLRLRESQQADARRNLVQAMEDFDRAELAWRGADAAIQHETRQAAQSDEDVDVERFAAWLTRGRARLHQAETTLAEAQTAVSHRRAELALARAAVVAVQSAIDARAAEAARMATRVEQRTLDEIRLQPTL